MARSLTFHVRWCPVTDLGEKCGASRDLAWDALGAAPSTSQARELGLVCESGGDSWRVRVCPTVPVRIEDIEATLGFDAVDWEAIFLNGYESWTDSVERPLMGRMWGLTRCPRRLVDHYVFDGSGDYRFVEEDARPGHQHGFSYGYLRSGNEVLLMGSLDEDSGMTVLREDAQAGTLTATKEVPARPLAAGESRELMGLSLVEGTLDAAVSRWLGLAGVTPRPCSPVVGFTSWYRHYDNITAECLAHDLEATAAMLAGTTPEGADAVFQVDDGYARVGDWLEPDPTDFPEGMAPIAKAACERGLTPGLWLAPFVCERESRLFSTHPDWLLRDDAGEPVATGCNWSGAVALDTRNLEVRAYVGEVLGTVTREWGYRLLKLDFLFAACMLPHDGMNRGELMADALDLLRASVPEGTRLLLCGVPLASAFGRCEYCRIGCDVGLDWDDKPYMRLFHRERVSTKNSLANTLGRAHLDGRAFRCDPDVFFLRDDVKLTSGQREQLLQANVASGGVLLTSDDMSAWTPTACARYRRALRDFAKRWEQMR